MIEKLQFYNEYLKLLLKYPNLWTEFSPIIKGGAGAGGNPLGIKIESGEIVSVAASLITGVLADARIPSLAESKITNLVADLAAKFSASNRQTAITNAELAGSIAEAKLLALSAGKITSGVFAAARIPSLDTSKITTGTLAAARLGSGATTSKFLRGDQTYQTVGGASESDNITIEGRTETLGTWLKVGI